MPTAVALPAAAVLAVVATWVSALTVSTGVSLAYLPALVAFTVAIHRGWRMLLVVAAAVTAAAAVIGAPADPTALAATRFAPLLVYLPWAVWTAASPFGPHSPRGIVRLWTSALGAGVSAATIVVLGAWATDVLTSGAWQVWQAVALAHVTTLFAYGPLVLTLAAPSRPPAPSAQRWSAAGLAVLAGLAGQLALMGMLPPIALITFGLTALLMARTSPVQAGLAVAAVAVGTTVVLLVVDVPGQVGLAQAGLVLLSVLAGGIGAHALASTRATRQAEEEQASLTTLLDTIAQAVVVITDGVVARVNSAGRQMVGGTVGQPLGGPDARWITSRGGEVPLLELLATPSGQGMTLRVGLVADAAPTRWFDVTSAAVEGAVHDSLVVTLRDATRDVEAAELARAEVSVLQHRADHDPLTGLGNRQRFERELDALSRPTGLWTGLVFADLDGFKQVNDVHGHEVGDEVLVQVGLRMRAVARASDLVIRLGGDEFVVLCRDLRPDLAEDVVRDLATRVRSAISDTAIATSAGLLSQAVSTGWAHAPAGPGLRSVLASADHAMLAAKEPNDQRRPRGSRPDTTGASHADGGSGDSRLRVFVVDDDPTMRLLASRIVEFGGVGARIVGDAADGRTAISEILELRPDVVVCDVMMPGMSGPELVERVRQHLPDVQFVLWSATTSRTRDEHGQRLGVPHIGKEDPQMILDLLRDLSGTR